MNVHMQNLFELQTLEFGSIGNKSNASQVAELRSQIPQPVLAHYDRLTERGKKGVAIVRNQVCGGCHMLLPIGTINTMMQGHDFQLCDSCGRYLYLPDPVESAVVETVAAAKPARKPRKRKALAHAV